MYAFKKDSLKVGNPSHQNCKVTQRTSYRGTREAVGFDFKKSTKKWSSESTFQQGLPGDLQSSAPFLAAIFTGLGLSLWPTIQVRVSPTGLYATLAYQTSPEFSMNGTKGWYGKRHWQSTKQPQKVLVVVLVLHRDRTTGEMKPFVTISLVDNEHICQPLEGAEMRWQTWKPTDQWVHAGISECTNSVSQWPQPRTTWVGLNEVEGGSARAGLSSLCWTLLLDGNWTWSVNAGLRSSSTICWDRENRRYGQSS